MVNGWKGAWTGILCPPVGNRERKPREKGLTMIIDTGLSTVQLRELLELGSSYIDIVKLSFGTPALYPTDVLTRKIALCREYDVDVCPGGTLLEIAVAQNIVRDFLLIARSCGFSCIEVSDGTINIPQKSRHSLIRRCRKLGFKVLTEVGKKDPALNKSPEELASQMESDLDDGAFKVIVEARESGKGVGIFDKSGQVKAGDLEQIVSLVRQTDMILWEAPMKEQQVELLLRFGPNVNLGNVPPSDVLSLEALRLGMRSDTFRTVLAFDVKQLKQDRREPGCHQRSHGHSFEKQHTDQ